MLTKGKNLGGSTQATQNLSAHNLLNCPAHPNLYSFQVLSLPSNLSEHLGLYPLRQLCTKLCHSLKRTLFSQKTRQGAGSDLPSKAGEQVPQSQLEK